MMVLGWGVGPGMRWGLIDGWTLAAKLGSAEDIYASELEDRLASQGLKLTWTGPSHADLKPMLWRERRARWALAQYGRKNFWQADASCTYRLARFIRLAVRRHISPPQNINHMSDPKLHQPGQEREHRNSGDP